MKARINVINIFVIRRLVGCTGTFDTSVTFERGAKWRKGYSIEEETWFCNIAASSLRRAQRAQLKLLAQEPK